ncbi:hypothetical protein HW132_26965 [Brasilonema sp. CT11]|nr:hypothetical protein [Brasilonema sp. CT11]
MPFVTGEDKQLKMFAKVSLQDEANSFNVRIVKQMNETKSGVNWIFYFKSGKNS